MKIVKIFNKRQLKHYYAVHVCNIIRGTLKKLMRLLTTVMCQVECRDSS